MLFIKHVVRQRAGAVFQIEARDSEDASRLDDLRRDRRRRADVERSVRAGFAFELRACGGRPAALAADAVDHRFVVRPELVLRPLVRRRHVSGRVHGNQAAWADRASRAPGDRDRRRAGIARGLPPMIASVNGRP